MKKIFVAIAVGCSAGVSALPSHAADLPLKAPLAPVVYNWSGFYFGGNIGADWASFNSDPFGFSTPAFTPSPDTGFGGTVGAALIGGGQFGANWQFNRLVLGLEAEVQDASHAQAIPFFGGFQCGAIGCGASPGVATARTNVEGSIRARVGVALDRWLVYGTGGFATAGVQVDAKSNVAALAAFPANNTSNREVLDGWTVGVGVEYAVTNMVSLGAQYRHTDFGHAQFPIFAGATATGANDFINVGLREDQVTARLNVKLDGRPGFVASATAPAAFVPAKAPPLLPDNWTGFYLGADLGGAFGSFNSDPFDFTATPAVLPPGFFFTGLPNVGLGGSASPGVIGGGQLGYNWQLGRFVVGFESDAQGTSLRQSATAQMFINCGIGACASTPGTVTARDLVQGSLRARLGYAFDRWLVYASGGWATADMQIASNPAATLPVAFRVPNSSNMEILNGWTLGAGFAYALTETVSVGAEYRHSDFGRAQFPVFAGATTGGFVAVPGFFSVGGNAIYAGLTEDQVTARVNVKLGSLFASPAVTW